MTLKSKLSPYLLLALALGAASCGLVAQSQDRDAAPRTALEVPAVNLPDFSQLVEAVGPAVVNIEATHEDARPEPAARGGAPVPEDMPEFFRRFFGQPGMPAIPDRAPRGGTAQGTGFLISEDGYVLTNHHVIDGADRIRVRLADRSELDAELVGSDPLSDIALLKVEGSDLPVLRIGDSRSLKAGQWVLAIGSPFGFEHSVTAGIVSGVDRRSFDPSQQYVPFIQTDVAINRGNSGGPLLNTRGEVVGVNSQIFSNSGGYMGVSFAIPIEVAMNAVRQLRETGTVARGQLGVRIQDVQREQLEELGLDRPLGAFVSVVENGSAADKAGIVPGDVIVAFDGREIPSSASLPPMVGALAPGSRATLTLLREGKRREVTVTLTALDASAVTGVPSPGRREAPATPANPLGLSVEALDAAARSAMGLGAREGVLVAEVTGQAARQAGLSAGDVILRVNQAEVGSVAEFEAATEGLERGDEVRLLVRNTRSTGFVSFVVQ